MSAPGGDGPAEALWVDGRLAPLAGPHLDARDRGFTLGDGLFETIRVLDAAPLVLDLHLARLRAGAGALAFPLPWGEDELRAAVAAALAAAPAAGAIRLSVSRGVPAVRGLLPDPRARPTLVVHAQPFGGYPVELYARGMRVVVASIRRNETSPQSRAKTLGYLDNVLARQEAAAAGADEALLLDSTGALAGASAANAILVVEGALLTPRLADGALPGTRRRLLLEAVAPRLGLPAAERRLTPEDLEAAAEVFLTSALLGAMPLVAVNGRPIGDGRPGPLTARVRKALESASRERTGEPA